MNNHFSRALLLAYPFILLGLGGCAVTGSVSDAVTSASIKAKFAEINDKCDFKADSRFLVLSGKVPLSAKDRMQPPTALELVNTSKPTERERQALIALDQEFQHCSGQLLSVADSSDANLANILRAIYNGYSIIDAKLLSSESTYAQWRQQRYQLSITAQKIMLDYEQAKREANSARMQAMSQQLLAIGAGGH